MKQRREILDICWWLQSPRYGFQTKQLESKSLYDQKITDNKITPCHQEMHFLYLGLARPFAPMGPKFGKTKWLSYTSRTYLNWSHQYLRTQTESLSPSGRFLHPDTELDALLDDADLVGFNFHPVVTVNNITVHCCENATGTETHRPNSVFTSRVPCWGTMRKSPSLLYIARLVMDLLQAYTWTAIPCLDLLSPAPAQTKTTFSLLSTRSVQR